MNKGDLVWIPSDITLLQFRTEEASSVDLAVNRWLKVKEPSNVLLVEKGDIYYKVFHEGERWHARKIDVYEAGV